MVIFSKKLFHLLCLITCLLSGSLAYAKSVALENQLPGTLSWQLTQPALNGEVEGYASHTSVNQGQSIQFYINSSAPFVQIEVFRMGWYQGLGARQMMAPINIIGIVQPIPMPDSNGLVNCDWTPTFDLQTDADWVSGVYLAKLTESLEGKQSFIIFVVRNDNQNADLLFQLPVTTYQAYNFWGGKSTYAWGSEGGVPATRVSFNRPYAPSSNPAAAFGVGAGEFFTNVQPVSEGYPISSAGWDYNFLRWLEREGYSVSYITNLDTHRRPNILNNAKAFLSVGHDEYWSFEMRENVEQALASGVNLGFFSANTMYWQVRFSNDPITGASDRIMDIYKNYQLDPFSSDGDAANDNKITVRFRDLGRSEDQLLGVRYFHDPVDGDIIISNPNHTLMANTGLSVGDRLVGLLGYEVDERAGNEPVNTVTLAQSPAAGRLSHMVTYLADSGARVFSTGTMQWSWGLDDFGAPVLRSARMSPAAQQITRNVLSSFGANAVSLPVANNDNHTTLIGSVLTVNAPGILGNDTAGNNPASNGLTATLVSGPDNGQLQFDANGSFVYTPNQNFLGTDAFIYRVSDGPQTGN